MAGRTLERRVEEAEQAAGPAMQEQGRRIASLVPVRVPAEAQRLEASTQAAVDSTRVLHQDSEAFQRLRAAIQAMRLEELYRTDDEGHERPPQVFRNPAEAEQKHSASILEEARRTIASQARPGEPAPALPAQVKSDAELEGAQRTIDGYSRTISGDWFTREFLGEPVYGRYAGTPPVVTAEDDSYFATLAMAYGGFRPGMYYGGTNHIICGAYQAGLGEAEMMHLLTHEQLHYASYLGGGRDIRWRDDSGGPAFWLRGYWNLHEGMTELLTQHLTREHDLDPGSVAYPYETAICFVLEQAVGLEPLRQAYFGGDFTEVRRLLDERLGSGTFDALTSFQVNAEAYSFIMQKAGAAGMDTGSWESNPIMGQCFRQTAEMRQR